MDSPRGRISTNLVCKLDMISLLKVSLDHKQAQAMGRCPPLAWPMQCSTPSVAIKTCWLICLSFYVFNPLGWVWSMTKLCRALWWDTTFHQLSHTAWPMPMKNGQQQKWTKCCTTMISSIESSHCTGSIHPRVDQLTLVHLCQTTTTTNGLDLHNAMQMATAAVVVLRSDHSSLPGSSLYLHCNWTIT